MNRSALWLLVAIEALVVLPLPVTLPLFAGAEASASWPVLWLLAGGFLAACHGVAARSVPLALLLTWAGARTLVAGLPLRSTLLLASAVAVLALYVLAAGLPIGADRWLLGGLAAAALLTAWVGVEQVVGVDWTVRGLNAATGLAVRPFGWSARPQESSLAAMAWDVQQRSGFVMRSGVLGQPHGFLGHPNHFGVFLALALPAALRLAGLFHVPDRKGRFARRAKPAPSIRRRLGLPWIVGASLLTMILLSRSRTALAALGLLALVWLWPCLDRRLRLGSLALAGVGAAGLGYTVFTGAQTLGARVVAWRLGWEMTTGAPWVGWGLGTWRLWALDPRGPVAAEPRLTPFGWWETAFSEPMQLVFELGAVGLALGLLCLAQLARDAWRGWRAGGESQAWAGVSGVGLIALWTTSLLHYPPLAVPLLIAAARLRARA